MICGIQMKMIIDPGGAAGKTAPPYLLPLFLEQVMRRYYDESGDIAYPMVYHDDHGWTYEI